MDARFLKEFVVGVYLVQQCLGVGVAYLTALLHHLGHVTGHTQGGRGPFLLVLGWGQFDTLQVQSSTTCNNKIQMYLVPVFKKNFFHLLYCNMYLYLNNESKLIYLLSSPSLRYYALVTIFPKKITIYCNLCITFGCLFYLAILVECSFCHIKYSANCQTCL